MCVQTYVAIQYHRKTPKHIVVKCQNSKKEEKLSTFYKMNATGWEKIKRIPLFVQVNNKACSKKTFQKISGAGSATEKLYISESRSKGPLQPLLCLQHVQLFTERPVRGHLTPKMNIAFFIRNLMLNILL